MPASQPQPAGYFDEDVIGFGAAMKAAGITVSFSPGISVTPANGTFLARSGYAVSYRVSEDMCVAVVLCFALLCLRLHCTVVDACCRCRWDLWDSAEDGTFPTGIRQKLRLSGTPAASGAALSTVVR
jgi:hypothetical protein